MLNGGGVFIMEKNCCKFVTLKITHTVCYKPQFSNHNFRTTIFDIIRIDSTALMR